MPTCRIPLPIKSCALVKQPRGKGPGGYTGGLPRDAASGVVVKTPFIGSARMQDGTAKVAGEARLPD